MENKNFLEREQLEKIIDEQKKEIENLSKLNLMNGVFYLKLFAIASGILLASGIITIIEKFKGDGFVTFSTFLALGIFLIIIYYHKSNVHKLEDKGILSKEKIQNKEMEYNSANMVSVSSENLKEMLQQALEEQDYVLAAHIRDEINEKLTHAKLKNQKQ